MSHTHKAPFIEEILAITGEDPNRCYQCGKCSAGCPVRDYSDTPPNRVVRFVQLGMYDKALKSEMIQLCAGCMTCSTRCPQNFDLASFMDALREINFRKKDRTAISNTEKFHQSFLNQIKWFGKSYELGLIGEFKLRSGKLFQDVTLAPEMFLKGKISILPHTVKNTKTVSKIIDRALEKGGTK